MDYQIQLNIQLLDVGRIVKYSANKVTELVKFARDLRKTSSDVFVEEELADILGRARISTEVQDIFKRNVLQNTNIVSLADESPIALSTGAGPTLNRALREKDPKYLSSVIQLSFLSRFYDRSDFSLVLSQCMSRRSGDSFGARSIEGVLEACTSQASITIWDSYMYAAEQKLRQTALSHNSNLPNLEAIFQGRSMSATAILAGLDYFFLVQTLPENRKIVAKSFRGIGAMIVWAHYLLGLTVHVRDRHSGVTIFGASDDTPNLLIQESVPDLEEEILLLDADSEIVLRCYQDPEDRLSTIGDQEKHALLDWGTETMRRHFNSATLIKDEDPVYQDTASLIVAVALNASARLVYEELEDSDKQFRDLSIEAWRVFDSANIIFQSLSIKKEVPVAHIDSVQATEIGEIILPASVARVHGIIQSVRPRYSQDSLQKETCFLIGELAFTVLSLAHVYDIGKCAALPVSLRWDGWGLFRQNRTLEEFREGKADIAVVRDAFHQTAIELMLGKHMIDRAKDSFIISDFGWSIILGSAYGTDPSETKPSMFRIQQGVPTHARTGERKRFVEDGYIWGKTSPRCRVVDTGASYVPRSLACVTRRREFCTSVGDRFEVTVQLYIKYEGLGETTSSYGYQKLHDNLWRCLRTKACECPRKPLDRAPLGFSAATVTGDPYEVGQMMSDRKIEQRICIYLAQEHRALCFVYKGISGGDCRVVVKTKDCCEACALTAASSLQGNVLLLV
ncbi:hypothetical protein MMC27_007467 [Xylographa pallens]|nr:hypothetical protein [Xylographa pallens]